MFHNVLFVFLACILVDHVHARKSVSYQVSSAELSILQGYLADSHDTPLCVLIRSAGSTLEKKVSKLWLRQKHEKDAQFASWRLAGVNVTEFKQLPGYLQLNHETPTWPLLRCFLGPSLQYDFQSSDHLETKQLLHWLNELDQQHNQMIHGSVDMVEDSVNTHHFTLVVFPTLQQHDELEEAVFMTSKKLSQETSTNVIVVHSSSRNQREILQKYEVTRIPSVMLIEKAGMRQREQMLFGVHDITSGRLEIDMRARLVPVEHLTVIDFKQDVLPMKPLDDYIPYLVGIYAHWKEESALFLSSFSHAVEEFSALDANLRFGLVDAAKNPAVVSTFLSPQCLQHLPFFALFQKAKEGSSVNKTELLLTQPSPFTLSSSLREAGLVLTDRQYRPVIYQPYGYNVQMCGIRDGPSGDMCSTDERNCSTWLFPADFLSDFLQYPDTQNEESKKELAIPIATQADWQALSTMELKKSNGNTSMPVKVTVLIFIQHPCRSCEQNHEVFQKIHQHLFSNDSIAVGLVNCSLTPQMCQENHVSGFPTILAFRTHHPVHHCTVYCSQRGDCHQPVRQDYHGVMTVAAISEWIKAVSVSAVQPLYFSKPDWKQPESAQLVATVVPLDSDYLPLPPSKHKGYFYNLECFQFICEHLFGLARCFTANSRDIPAAEFDAEFNKFAITQVVFRRSDGIEIIIMQLGRSLAETLDEETNQALYMFHQQHSYSLNGRQKCEEDHSLCSQFLEQFTRDHLRLPVTALTSAILHSKNDFLFGRRVPVLLALVESESGADFVETLQKVAYALYKDVMVATLDVSLYSAWANSFVPRDYNKLHAESSDWGKLSMYPRLVLFYWDDHTRAAFYPAVTASTSTSAHSLVSDAATHHLNLLSEDLVTQFVQDFLHDPDASLIETERF